MSLLHEINNQMEAPVDKQGSGMSRRQAMKAVGSLAMSGFLSRVEPAAATRILSTDAPGIPGKGPDSDTTEVKGEAGPTPTPPGRESVATSTPTPDKDSRQEREKVGVATDMLGREVPMVRTSITLGVKDYEVDMLDVTQLADPKEYKLTLHSEQGKEPIIPGMYPQDVKKGDHTITGMVGIAAMNKTITLDYQTPWKRISIDPETGEQVESPEIYAAEVMLMAVPNFDKNGKVDSKIKWGLLPVVVQVRPEDVNSEDTQIPQVVAWTEHRVEEGVDKASPGRKSIKGPGGIKSVPDKQIKAMPGDPNYSKQLEAGLGVWENRAGQGVFAGLVIDPETEGLNLMEKSSDGKAVCPANTPAGRAYCLGLSLTQEGLSVPDFKRTFTDGTSWSHITQIGDWMGIHPSPAGLVRSATFVKK